jgi:hypothetical protein
MRRKQLVSLPACQKLRKLYRMLPASPLACLHRRKLYRMLLLLPSRSRSILQC